MKNIYLISAVCCSLFFTACTKQLGSPKPQADIAAKIPAYEQQLKTYVASVPQFAAQAADIRAMDPSVIFSFSHNCLVKEDYDQAIFWYYLAQYRAIIIHNAAFGDLVVDNDYFSTVYKECGLAGEPYIIGSVSRQMLYRAIMQYYGVAITQAGIRNTKNTAELICAALNYEDKYPLKTRAAAGGDVENPIKVSAYKKRVRKALEDFVKDLQTGDVGKKQYLK